MCQNSTPAEEVHIISHCNLFGKWVPNPTEFCSGMYHLEVQPYASLGEYNHVCVYGGGGECIYGVAIDAPLSLRHNE